ncbi:MAG TPA: lysophospholipid acyltransferase family protein [Phycisphaerae bacterium]|nr:lysophospholipid acyltransferase family protein [Phycisphaerae bacterium]
MNLEPLRYIYLRRVVGTALAAMGFEAAEGLACRVARAVFNLNTPAHRAAEARLAAATRPPADHAPSDVPLTMASMYEHIARFWIEALFARRLLRDSTWRRCVHVGNEPELRALAEARRGCLLATAYFGNPAVGVWTLGRIFRPVHVIVDTFTQPYLRAWQRELYADRWIRPIERTDAVRALPQLLAAGGAVVMVCEHERRRGHAVPATFLGRDLNCYPTIDRLCHWFEVPVAVVTCRRGHAAGPHRPRAMVHRHRPFSFELALHETIAPEAVTGGDGDITRRVMSALERVIMKHPEQYLWSSPVSPIR